MDQPLCECGCGAKVNNRFVRGHNRGRTRTDQEHLAFMQTNVVSEDRGYETECHIWQGRRTKGDYALTNRPGTNTSTTAHRRVYEITNGVTLPRTIAVDHKCNQPACVNIDHLQALTYAANSHRSAVSKLTPDKVRELRVLRAGGLTYRALAKRYDISAQQVFRIATRRSWKTIV